MKVELLAPAGSWEAMEGALGAGADAVYLGGNQFGARAYAQNFGEDELLRAIDYAHLRNCKLYLTVNTLFKNLELSQRLDAYLLPLYRQGLDGVIVQDLGVLQYIQQRFPKLPVHASTQMTITGVNGAKMLERAGAVRIVPARELTLEELQNIRRETSLEIEAFVHGALCYCYSGQCLFSSMLGGRSGNRGRCAQPCRLPYEAGGRRGNLLSPKDMCTVELLPEILAAGVSSLKIEGRMKQPGYVAGVVSVYRKYLDYCLEGKSAAQWDRRQLKKDLEFLRQLFCRGGFCTGYYKEKPGPSMIAFENEKKTGDCPVEIIKRKEKIKGYLMLSSDSRAILEVSSRAGSVTVTGQAPQKAVKRPMDRERILSQMKKTNDTPFWFEDFRLDMTEDLFVPVGQLNSLRRKGIEALEQKLLEPYRREAKAEPLILAREKPAGPAQKEKREILLSASCDAMDQFEALDEIAGIREIYLSVPLFEKLYRERGAEYLQDLAGRKKWLLALPHVTRERDLARISKACDQALSLGAEGFLARNLESFSFLAQKGWADKCHLDAGLYAYNDWAADFWRKQKAAADMVPLELNLKEIAHRDNSRSYMTVYGYIPLMASAQCVQKNVAKCDGAGRRLLLRDRYKKEFPVQCYCDFCYNIIYNSLPYGLLEYRRELLKAGLSRFFLSFTVESRARTAQVARAFWRVYGQGAEAAAEGFSFTKGHMKRKVE